MEVNNLSYRTYMLLKKNNWSYEGEYDNKFFYMNPSSDASNELKIKIALPISSKSKNFYRYMKGILDFLLETHPIDKRRIHNLITLNENLKHRFDKKWIIPEIRSQIPSSNKFDIYIPFIKF